MTETKHTKGKLRTKKGDRRKVVTGENDDIQFICNCVIHNGMTPRRPKMTAEEACANASRVVLTWNCHDDLLEVLEKCLRDEMNRRKKLLNKSTAACYADDRIEQMKAAITKAKGDS